jgi:hypothetical protein
MADIIKIKRSDTTATPSSLAAGELAYSEDSGNLFIGRISDGAPVKIGGKTDADKLAGIAAGAEVNAVDSVAGRTGDVVITHADLADFDTEVDGRIALADLNDLADVNAGSPSDDQVLTWNNGTGRWVASAPGTGVTQFVSLNDTPANFTSAGGFFVKVNSGANALEFVESIDGGTF